MRQAPNLWQFENLPGIKTPIEVFAGIKGKWVPARPLGEYSLRNRLRLAWLVFTGKADALVWPDGQ